MNKARRKQIEKAIAILGEAASDEQLAFDNMPEGIQDGERGQAMTDNVYAIEAAVAELAEIDGVEASY
jgi:hypothetical protein